MNIIIPILLDLLFVYESSSIDGSSSAEDPRTQILDENHIKNSTLFKSIEESLSGKSTQPTQISRKNSKRRLFDWFAIYGKEHDEERPEVFQIYQKEKAVVLPGQPTTTTTTTTTLTTTTTTRSSVEPESIETSFDRLSESWEILTEPQEIENSIELIGSNTKRKISIERIEAHLEWSTNTPRKKSKKRKEKKMKSDEYLKTDLRGKEDFENVQAFLNAIAGNQGKSTTISPKDQLEQPNESSPSPLSEELEKENKLDEQGSLDPSPSLDSNEESLNTPNVLATVAPESLESDEFVDTDKKEMEDETKLEEFLEDLSNSKNETEKSILEKNKVPQLLGIVNETLDFDSENSTNLTSFEYEFSLNGTEMELRESFGSIQMSKGRKYRPRSFERASLDEALLESELMSYKVDVNETETLRELLVDPLRLENDDYADSHRDYGSSFIIPVLSAINYDNCTVPLIFAEIPVNVRVQFHIIHLANFDSEQMEYTVDMELEMRWYDLRLRNNYTKPVLLREKAVIDKIWRPDPYFVNSKYSYFHRVSFPNFRMRITPEGLVTYTMRVSLLPSCQMVFCKYPHDRQRCDLLLSSIAYPHSFVNFSWNTVPFTFKSAIALPELHINTISAEECQVENKLLHSSCLRLLFLLERDGGRFIVEKYVPSTLAMMFAWVAPYVPYNYEDVRIVTPIMVLLALVQMEKDDSAIRTSYLTSMNVWFGVMKAFSVLSLIESLVILAFIKRSRAMEKNASRAVTELEREYFLAEKRRSLRHAHVLDQICRVLSPVTFIVFFNYYVLFVAQGDDNDCVRRQPYKGFLPE